VNVGLTGYSGFLGKFIIEAMPLVVPITRPVRHDPGSLKYILHYHKIKTIIHAAGMSTVVGAGADPLAAYEENVNGVKSILQAIAGTRVRLIYIATDKVFGDQLDCTPKTPIKPLTTYDCSKAMAEIMLDDFAKKHDVVTLRFPNFYGPGDRNHTRLFPTIIECLKGQTELRLRTNLDQRRQYIFVRDAARIVARIATEGTSLKKHHFGPDNFKSVRDIIGDLSLLFGKTPKVIELNQLGESPQLSIKTHTDLPNLEFTPWGESLRSFL
jgi:nucleoside-diphosphate-sugar epimerase